ncbi:MAG TPA: molybdopterin-binding/glycosyltransferase family 2 protein [Candidatus Angelobacter sp.]|nr:molybdopterin-binding/glycosyltransferase family 2 protein [Candidatus Angelobacter sp.]
MIFADLPVLEAEGALLVHSIRVGKLAFRKGRTLSADDVRALADAGRATATVARLDRDDIGEDIAATRIAQALAGPNVTLATAFTGRCNVLATAAGVLVVDRERLDRINLLDEAVTIATLPPYDVAQPREMVATVKIIPFAVSQAVLDACIAVAADGGPLVRVSAFRSRSVGLIQTRLPGIKESVLDKTVDVINGRLAALGCPPVNESRCAHDTAALAAAIAEMRGRGTELVLIAGASAITDRRDVIPAAIERAGGRVDHFGMPVDPGNLLLLGRLADDTHVLGLPGCVRSPKVNGFDWVLQRLIADLPVTRADIMRMGAGGLLKEIPTRPQPRAGTEETATVAAPRAPRIAAILLAAGRSSRMGVANKLLTDIDGAPMVRHAVEAATASHARPVIVVTGNEQGKVQAALRGCKATFVHNPRFAEGMSTSLQAGLAALPANVDGALVCLGDMPLVTAAALDRLIAAFSPLEGRAICVPTWNGKRGNPVLWDRRFFVAMADLAGDVGAKHLIGEHADLVAEVAMSDDAVLTDIDTPEALAALRQAGTKQA